MQHWPPSQLIFGQRAAEEKEKEVYLLFNPPLQGHLYGVVNGAGVDGQLLESHAVLAISPAPARSCSNIYLNQTPAIYDSSCPFFGVNPCYGVCPHYAVSP